MQSMTGYGSAQKRNGNFHIEIEVRSVNHRFINLKQSLPDGLVRHENEIDKLLRQKVHRGSVTVLVTLKPIHHRTQNLPDAKTIKTFVQHLRKIQKEVNSLDDEKDYEHVKDKLLDSIPSDYEIYVLIKEHIKFKLKLIHLIKRYYPDSSLVHNISPRKLTKVLDEFQVTSLDRNPIN